MTSKELIEITRSDNNSIKIRIETIEDGTNGQVMTESSDNNSIKIRIETFH